MPIVGAQLQWLIQITTAEKQSTSVNRNLSSEVSRGLAMSIFGFCIICYRQRAGQMVASIRRSRFRVSLVLVPGLCHRRNYLVEKQSAVGSLVFA